MQEVSRKSEINCGNSLLNSLGTYASEKGSTSDKMAVCSHICLYVGKTESFQILMVWEQCSFRDFGTV